jgi:lipid-binding SYLF domain-containing protein
MKAMQCQGQQWRGRGSWQSIMSVMIAAVISASLCGFSAPAQAASKEEERQSIRRHAAGTLDDLYEVAPGARKAVENAAGYAVFSNFGLKIMVAGGGTGEGIVIDKKSGTETFMKMAEIQAGLGFGVKKYRLVWVFERKSDLEEFVNTGLELGAQATAAAQVQGMGDAFAGAMSIRPGVWLYQITDDGLALELTAKGTRYYKDADLN